MQTTQSRFRAVHLLIALVLPLGIWIASLGLMSFDPVPNGVDIASGSGIFRDHCGACHIFDKGITLHHGPNFYDIGKVAGTRKPELTAAEYILESILDPEAFVAPDNHKGMPRNLAHDLTSDEIRNIVAYLAGRGAEPDYDEILALQIPDPPAERPVRIVRRQDMELAEKVLRERGECLHCHSVHRNAEHQAFAPGLFGVGLVDSQTVRESIVDPNKVVSPAHANVKVLLESGKVVSGRLISQTDDGLMLLARDELNNPIRVEIDISEIEQEDGQPMIVRSETSPMPAGVNQLLTSEELEAVISMIVQLN